jgi:hypothetical protein
MADIKIKILRGLHTNDAIPDLLPQLENADIVLIEFVRSKSESQMLFKALNLLGSNKEYVEIFSKNLETNLDNNFIRLLGWELRGQHKYIDFVDVFMSDEAYSSEFVKLLPWQGVDELLLAIKNDPSRRYELINEMVARDAQIIKERDVVVVNQIISIIKNKDNNVVDKILREKGRCNIAVVQGYVHHITPYLRQSLRDVDMAEVFYGPSDSRLFIEKNPIMKLLRLKLSSSNDAISDKDIDYCLYRLSLLSATSKKNHDEKEKTDIEKHKEILEEGMNHSSIKNIMKDNNVIPIEDFTAAKLRNLAMKIIASKDF